MSGRTSIAIVLTIVLGLSWLSAAVSGSSEWGIGAFAVIAIMVFLINRKPALQN